MYVFNFLDFSELLINDSVTSCDVKFFFFIPATNLVRVKSENISHVTQLPLVQQKILRFFLVNFLKFDLLFSRLTPHLFLIVKMHLLLM